MTVLPAAPSAATLGTVALTLLVLWRVYVRFRRAVTRQRLTRWRAPVTLALYALLLMLLGAALRHQPWLLLDLAAFVLAGVLLARFGLARTVFDAAPGGLFYTPFKPLSLTLALLFAARVAWRIWDVWLSHDGADHTTREFMSSPLTLSSFGLLAGYAMAYAVGLARWRWRVLRGRQP